MVKLMGSAMVFAACLYIGIKNSLKLSKREKSLGDILTMLTLLESEIGFGANRLYKALRSADRNGLFTLAADKLKDMSAKEAIVTAVREKEKSLCLMQSDTEIIEVMASTIGKRDREGEVRSIAYVKKLIQSQWEEAKADRERYGRLYAVGGGLLGAFFVIILI